MQALYPRTDTSPTTEGEGTVRNMASVRRARPLPRLRRLPCGSEGQIILAASRDPDLGTKAALDQRVASALRFSEHSTSGLPRRVRAREIGMLAPELLLHARKAIFLGHMC